MARPNYRLDNIIVDQGQLGSKASIAYELYQFEAVLGRLLLLVSVVAFVGINLLGLAQGKIYFYEIYTNSSALGSALNSALTDNLMYWSVLLTPFLIAYALYLKRDKDRYQSSIQHHTLGYLRKLIGDSTLSTYLEKNEILLHDFLDTKALILLATVMRTEYPKLKLLEMLVLDKQNKLLLKRLDLEVKELDQITERYGQLLVQQKDKDLSSLLKNSLVDAMEMDSDYVDLTSLLLTLLRQDLAGLLVNFDLHPEDLNAIFAWQKISLRKKQLVRKARELARIKPTDEVNSAFTSVYSPSVEEYCTDLTKTLELELLGKDIAAEFDYSYREAELKQIINILDLENGVLLLKGDVGVGKTTLINTFVMEVVADEVPVSLRDVRVLELNTTKLLRLADTPGQLTDVLRKIFAEQERSGNMVIIVDDIDQILNLRGDLQNEIISILATELRKVKVKLIATITNENYARYFNQEEELLSIFQEIELAQASKEVSMQVLLDNLSEVDAKFKVSVELPAIRRIIEVSNQMEFNKALPDKALDQMLAVAEYAYLKGLKFVDKDVVNNYYADKVGVVVPGTVGEGVTKQLQQLEQNLRSHVIGQDTAIAAVTSALRRNVAGLGDKNKPAASFLFYGPTGVGKTHLSQALAKFYYGKDGLFLRIDMSEFQEEENLARLLGADKGNIYTPGVLTEFVAKHPYSLVLLDEIEKANPKVLDIFLQILDNASVKDGLGRDVSFANVIIIATSNVGSKLINQLQQQDKAYKEIQPKAFAQLKEEFRLEFLNRFDEVIMFSPLSKLEVHEVARLLLQSEKELLAEKGIEFIYSDKTVDYLAGKGYSADFGARELRRTVAQEIEDKVAKAILAGKLKSGDIFSLE
jgi:ATP-dependent Clp protease ATP-binding subunit ClpC